MALKLLFNIEWWAHVIDTPEVIKIIVFKRGTLIGLNLVILTGGHICPSSILGLKEKWKNLQKKEKKNIISDVMKRIIPIFKPFKTSVWCNPWKVTSRITSFHQANAEMARIAFTIKKIFLKLKNNWKFKLKANSMASSEATKGQGLIDTIW